MKQIYTNYDELPLNLSVMQVADVLGISRAGAYELLHSKGFPKLKIGENRYIIPKNKLILWIESQTEGGNCL